MATPPLEVARVIYDLPRALYPRKLDQALEPADGQHRAGLAAAAFSSQSISPFSAARIEGSVASRIQFALPR